MCPAYRYSGMHLFCLYMFVRRIANCVICVSFMARTSVVKTPEVMLNLYRPKTLVRPHLEYCISAWSPHYQTDKKLLEKVQHRFTRMITSLKSLQYEARLQKLGLWTLEERRNRPDLIEVFKMARGFSAIPLTDMF